MSDGVPTRCLNLLDRFSTRWQSGVPIIADYREQADWLAEHGFLETVDNPQYPNEACYRLTELGRVTKQPGRRAKVAMLQPGTATPKLAFGK